MQNTKICNKCNEEKSIDDFAKSSNGKKHNHCKKCFNIYQRERYRNNPKVKMYNWEKHRKPLRLKRKRYIYAIKIKYGCKCCGIKDPLILEFHHFNSSDKEFNIYAGDNCSITRLIEEINKCVVLCANCHILVHYRVIILNEDMMCIESVPTKEEYQQISDSITLPDVISPTIPI